MVSSQCCSLRELVKKFKALSNILYRYCSNKLLVCVCPEAIARKKQQQSKWKAGFLFQNRRLFEMASHSIRDYSCLTVKVVIFWNRMKPTETCLKTEFIIIFSFRNEATATKRKLHVKHKNDNFFHFKWQVHLDLLLHDA